jgi:GPI mannosyltransferase 4
MNAPFSMTDKWLWIGLLILRVAFVIQPGYVHPDEFFQSSEVAARSVFHFDTFVPWEFVTGCRSILPP